MSVTGMDLLLLYFLCLVHKLKTLNSHKPLFCDVNLLGNQCDEETYIVIVHPV
jgi:hypothetical protein